MVTVDQAGQTLLDHVEERVERSKGRVLRISHNFAPSLSMCRANRQQHQSDRIALPCQVLPGACCTSFVMLRLHWPRLLSSCTKSIPTSQVSENARFLRLVAAPPA